MECSKNYGSCIQGENQVTLAGGSQGKTNWLLGTSWGRNHHFWQSLRERREKGRKSKELPSPLGSHWCKSKWSPERADNAIFDQHCINFTFLVICVDFMELLQTYSRANGDRPKPREKILFVRRIIWVRTSMQDLAIKNLQVSLNFLGMVWKLTMSVWTIFHLLIEKLKYLKVSILWNKLIIMHMYKEYTSRQPCRGELKFVHREILFPVFLNPVIHTYFKKIT